MIALRKKLSADNIKDAFWTSFFASVLFLLVFLFYNNEYIRSSIEDLAFDIVNQFVLAETPQTTDSPYVHLFAVDDHYMQTEQLLTTEGQPNYGYLFPRDHIARFIERLDKLSAEVAPENRPQALFIDYDMSFTTLPYGKALSTEDETLLTVLKRPRDYTILLPKTEQANFIENSTDADIQQLLKTGKIQMVSVPLLVSNDGLAQRYQLSKTFTQHNQDQRYDSVNLALWRLGNQQAKQHKTPRVTFQQDDIIANRIWFKRYKTTEKTDACHIQQSHWQQLNKYSASCSLFDIIEEDIANSLILYGGTFHQNPDQFKILGAISAQHFAGIDMHANALMTMLHLQGGMQRISLPSSLFIVFFTFLFLELIIPVALKPLSFATNNIVEILVLITATLFFFLLSSYFLKAHQLWFNWFVPVILFELIKVSYFMKRTFHKSWINLKALLKKALNGTLQR
jgi:hypothetical protein